MPQEQHIGIEHLPVEAQASYFAEFQQYHTPDEHKVVWDLGKTIEWDYEILREHQSHHHETILRSFMLAGCASIHSAQVLEEFVQAVGSTSQENELIIIDRNAIANLQLIRDYLSRSSSQFTQIIHKRNLLHTQLPAKSVDYLLTNFVHSFIEPDDQISFMREMRRITHKQSIISSTITTVISEGLDQSGEQIDEWGNRIISYSSGLSYLDLHPAFIAHIAGECGLEVEFREQEIQRSTNGYFAVQHIIWQRND
jgi:hypothetical protein